MRLMFLLSGEHPTLPEAEVRGAIKAEGCAYELVERLDQVLVLETEARASKIAGRLAMCREVCLHLCTANADEILEAVGSSDLPDFLDVRRTFAVRVERVKTHCPEVERAKLERELADLLLSEFRLRVDLESPETELVGILTDGKCVVGLRLCETARKQARLRRPSARAAFHPSTLPPVLARCMVNLARTPKNGTLCDPFCGVGGILVEAGLIGARVVGFDIDPKMVEGAKRNLEFYGVRNFEVSLGDARKLPEMEVDAVVTDPPFGVQASTGGLRLEDLLSESLPAISRVLKRKGMACLGVPSGISLEELAKDSGLNTVEVHEQYVHKSLTRKIYVLKKP
jgi:tRNA (guanine10-N2)-dimethyltransferase